MVKPLTFMNLSGQAVGELARCFKIDPADALVIVGEFNCPWAASVPRARVGWQANGLRSIEAHLGTDQYRGCASASSEAMDAGISGIMS